MGERFFVLTLLCGIMLGCDIPKIRQNRSKIDKRRIILCYGFLFMGILYLSIGFIFEIFVPNLQSLADFMFGDWGKNIASYLRTTS